MLRRLALRTLVAALVVPASASAAPTIKVGGDKYREVLYPDTFRIKGKTGDYRGQVTLEADEFPFEGNFGDMATVSTNDKGEYVFPKIGPTRNTRLRVRAGGERSKSTTVFVHPGVKRKERLVADYRVRTTFTYIGHPGFAPPPDAFFAYLSRSDDRSRVHRLGGARTMSQVKDGSWRYTGILKLPKGNYRYGVLYCTRGLSAAGYGRFWTIDRKCGDKSVRLSKNGN